jgi:O-antigen/teichoic acid export membrane protein
VGRGWPRLRVGIHDGWIGHRGRNILHTGGWSLVAKACTATNLFLCVPFVLHALGPEQFGAWATLVSLVAFAGFLDFGFGNGAMNLLAAAHGRNSPREVATILHEGRRALLRIALWLAVAALVALPMVPWHRMLGMPDSMSSASRNAVAAVLFSIVLAVPLNLANRVQLGLGRGDRAFRWQAIGQLATLAMVIALARAHASLTALTAAAVATPLLASVANTYSVWRDPALAAASPMAGPERANIARRIRDEGILFFGLQLTAALAFSADLPLIAALRGPAEAGTYAIVQRLFSVIPLALSLIWAPLWPIYRQALAAGDHQWVKRTLRHSLKSAVALATIGAAVLAFGFDPITVLWVHKPLVVGGVLLAGFSAWCVVEAAGTALATFLNAASVLRYQLVTACVFATICLVGKVLAITHLGIAWVPWVTVVTYCLASVLPFLWFGRRIFFDAFTRTY